MASLVCMCDLVIATYMASLVSIPDICTILGHSHVICIDVVLGRIWYLLVEGSSMVVSSGALVAPKKWGWGSVHETS